MFKKFEKNTEGRDFIMGDVHGMFHLVEDLMDLVSFDPAKDRMFVCGDLVDRGPHSKDVANWLKQPWFHSVRGNHEQLALEAYEAMDRGEHVASSDKMGVHMVNGGGWFYEMSGDKQFTVVAELVKLPLAIEIDTDNGPVGIVHAEVPGDDWKEFTEALINPPINYEHFEHYALWSRDILKRVERFGLKYDGVANIPLVFVGHSPVKEQKRVANIEYIDTGAAFGRQLSMMCVQGSDAGKLFQTSSDFKWSR